jgi:hypothetical protein
VKRARIHALTALVPILCVSLAGPALAEEPAPAAEAAAAEPAAPVAGYDKGFFIRSADGTFELKLNGRVHGLFSYLNKDAGEEREHETAFAISTARLTLSGKAFLPDLTYYFETDFGRGFVKLLDFYADYAFAPKLLHLRVGQWKRPFLRQFMNSSGKYEMVERSPMNGFFGEGYDIGLALHDNYQKSPAFEWVVGVWNGTGSADKPWFAGSGSVDTDGAVEVTKGGFNNVPTRFHPVLVARVGYNHGGIDGYSEGDLEGGPFRFSVAANALLDFDVDDDGKSGVRAGLDYALKLEGFSLTGGFYVATAQAAAAAGEETGFADQEYAGAGAYLQAGYVIAGLVQPVVRYSIVSPDGQRSGQEIAAGVSVYFARHAFKWQLLGSARVNPGALQGKDPGGSDRVDGQVLTHLVATF